VVGGVNASQVLSRSRAIVWNPGVLWVVKVDCWSLEGVTEYEPSWISSLLEFFWVFKDLF
jgi:hypothetical protein